MQSHSWFRRQGWSLLVWFLCAPASLIPYYLARTRHDPPVGAYIAIVGGLAAFVTFRDRMPRPEKAAWIFIITLLIVAEIRNLYVADADQLEKFRKISSALDATKKGLDATASGIDTTAKALNQSIADSQAEFSATMGRTNAVLPNITGGKSYGALVPMLPNLLPGQKRG